MHVYKAENPITNPSKSELVEGRLLTEDDKGKQGSEEYQTSTQA